MAEKSAVQSIINEKLFTDAAVFRTPISTDGKIPGVHQ
jgi:hypothetical protein